MCKYTQFKWNFPIWADNSPSKSYRPDNTNPNTSHENRSLFRMVQETLKIVQATAFAPGYAPEAEDKYLLLKISMHFRYRTKRT